MNKGDQIEITQKFWNVMFTSGTAEQVENVQQQIENFKYTYNPVFNANQIKIQIRIAFVMNLSYLYIIWNLQQSKFELQELWLVNYLWLLVMSALNLLLILPKSILVMMMHQVFKRSICIDDLIVNVVLLIKSRVFIFNQTISKMIVYGYIVGFILCVVNMVFETEEIRDLGFSIIYLQILFTARIIYAGIAVSKDEKGLNEDQVQKMIQKQSQILSHNDVAKISDCCSICVEDYCAGEQTMTLNCQHIFHTKCIQQWLPIQNKCPNCNQYILKCL